MKKYILLGFAFGVATALLLVLFKRRESGNEFEELYDSSTIPQQLFGSAFKISNSFYC